MSPLGAKIPKNASHLQIEAKRFNIKKKKELKILKIEAF